MRPEEALADDAKDQKQGHRAGRQARCKEEGATRRINVAPAEGASANPSARIIIVIWWMNIAWLSQTHAVRRRTAWTMSPAIATPRPTAAQPLSAAETCSTRDVRAAGTAFSAAPETSGRSRWDRSPLIYDASASARTTSPSWRRPGIRRLASRLSMPKLRPAWAAANMPWVQMMPI